MLIYLGHRLYFLCYCRSCILKVPKTINVDHAPIKFTKQLNYLLESAIFKLNGTLVLCFIFKLNFNS